MRNQIVDEFKFCKVGSVPQGDTMVGAEWKTLELGSL